MTGTKEAQVTVVCLRYAGEPSKCDESPILPVDSDGVAVSVSDGPNQRPGGRWQRRGYHHYDYYWKESREGNKKMRTYLHQSLLKLNLISLCRGDVFVCVLQIQVKAASGREEEGQNIKFKERVSKRIAPKQKKK